ncbi:trypsin-like peptidase domain-containing protein [Luteolibacter arcticus]|uniref:Trypsin-like peptidase domain-containing protein n=1 Tax=Luteolibacter arcticus TaxID=1581411 RepID=A0ABT3GJH5_9BACT|nr:serine protease [Luteolibacter arcticus]MCW1923649.1 trypsin-like peptidase domain-containing protein [Luteolibacter arcticus]
MKLRMIALLASALLSSHGQAQDGDATKLFKSMEPSVVLISDEEGGGSGVVISADGLILTNAHVAGTALPLTVEAMVTEAGKEVRKSFPNATVQKIHPTNDLALLKVTAPGCRFHPAALSKSDADTKAGGTCYVMGFPYLPDQDKPEITITKGIVSAARRMVGGSPYIQLDAAINPGNSGGALINERGVVIGIPTLRFEGSDRIGMAAPVAGLKLEAFVDPKEAKGDPAEAKRLSTIAARLYASDLFSLGTDDEAVAVAIYMQRQAIALEPNNPEWSIAIASMYRRLNKLSLARAYAENAVKLAPKHLGSRTVLAAIHDELKEPAKAAAQRLQALPLLAEDTKPDVKKFLFEKLAENLIETDDGVRAVYVVSWAQAAVGGGGGPGQRLILQTAGQKVPEALVREILDKKSGHSIEDMEAMARKAPAAGSTPPAAPQPAANNDQAATADASASASTVVSKVNFKSGATARLADAPPGVVFHQESSTVEWTPPTFSRMEETRVLFVLTHPDGSEELQVHTVRRK